MKTSSRALPAFPLLGQWNAGEKEKGRFASAGEAHWQAEEKWSSQMRTESGHGEVGRYTAYENEKRREAIKEKQAGPESKKRTTPAPRASDAALGINSKGVIAGVNAPPELERQKVPELEENQADQMPKAEENKINPLYAQGNETSAIALEQVSNAMSRAGTTPAHRMIGSAQFTANPKQVDQAKYWATASDPKTGATYWYHKQTGQTTWTNPDPTKRQAKMGLQKREISTENRGILMKIAKIG